MQQLLLANIQSASIAGGGLSPRKAGLPFVGVTETMRLWQHLQAWVRGLNPECSFSLASSAAGNATETASGSWSQSMYRVKAI